MSGCNFEVNPEELEWLLTICLLFFGPPDLGIEIFFEKEGATE